jgi:hypothetical protein
MYSIPWFITYMANKFLHVDILLDFWECIVKRDDPTFIFFFLIALIIHNSSLIKTSESAKLPEVMTNLKITTQLQLDQIWTSAEFLEQQTPHSFKLMPEVLTIFTKNAKNLKESCLKLEQLYCLPMMTSEMLFYAFHGEVKCSNPVCSQSLTYIK